MFAWRGRIGLVNPTHRGKVFAGWYTSVPEGIELVPSWIGFRNSNAEVFEAGIARAEELAEDLVSRGCDAISISGSPPFLLKGPEYEIEWQKKLTDRLGVPVSTPVLPHVLALRALGVQRVAIGTYYDDTLNNAIVDYFAHFGIEGVAFGGLGAGAGEDLYAIKLADLDHVDFQEVYRYCKQGIKNLDKPVDAIYLNGAGWDVPPAIPYLERDLSLPIVYAIAAEIWNTLGMMSVDADLEHLGGPLRDHLPLPTEFP